MGLWVFFLRSLLFATSFFLSISEKCSYIRDCSCTCIHVYLLIRWFPRTCSKKPAQLLLHIMTIFLESTVYSCYTYTANTGCTHTHTHTHTYTHIHTHSLFSQSLWWEKQWVRGPSSMRARPCHLPAASSSELGGSGPEEEVGPSWRQYWLWWCECEPEGR